MKKEKYWYCYQILVFALFHGTSEKNCSVTKTLSTVKLILNTPLSFKTAISWTFKITKQINVFLLKG